MSQTSPVAQSIWLLLKHSIVTLILVILLAGVFIIFQVALPLAELEAEKAFQAALMINLTLSSFLGVYLGGGLLSLKQNYLWTINRHYRGAILAAYLIIIAVFCLIQMPFLTMNLDRTWMILFVPFCIAIFASQMVMGKNSILKIMIPVTPYAIAQLYRFDISAEIIVLLIMFSTAILLATLYYDRLYPDSLSREKTKEESSIGNSSLSTGLSLSFIMSVNHYITISVYWSQNGLQIVKRMSLGQFYYLTQN